MTANATADLSAIPGPVTRDERISSIDVLRGFALLGILVINIQVFSMISAMYLNPTATGKLLGANYVVWFASHVLFDHKMMPIFAMLFGGSLSVSPFLLGSTVGLVAEPAFWPYLTAVCWFQFITAVLFVRLLVVWLR